VRGGKACDQWVPQDIARRTGLPQGRWWRDSLWEPRPRGDEKAAGVATPALQKGREGQAGGRRWRCCPTGDGQAAAGMGMPALQKGEDGQEASCCPTKAARA